MADTKISALTSLTSTGVDPAADVLAIVDTSVTTTKKITVTALAQASIVLGTEQASTSGNSIDFTSIPSGVKRIVIMFVGVSTNGTAAIIVQIGDSGGIETTGYSGSLISTISGSANTGSARTDGFGVSNPAAASSLFHGSLILSLENSSAFTWVGQGITGLSTGNQTDQSGGSKSTSAELDRVRITTANGTDTFDAGVINISFT